MAKVQSPYEKAKDSITRKRCSVDGLKFELRKQFKSRLREMRSKSVDACRNLTHDVNEGYRDLVQSLEKGVHKFDFVQPDDVLKTLKEIQDELLEQVVNQELIDYESFLQEEVDSVVENLISCKICKEYSENDICDNCSICFSE